VFLQSGPLYHALVFFSEKNKIGALFQRGFPMIRLRAALAVLFLSAGTLPLAAQSDDLTYDHRVVGDRALSILIGPVLPEGFQTFGGTLEKSNLFAVGGTLGLSLDFYLDDHWSVGGSLRGNATFSVNENTLFLVPITVEGKYEFKVFPFSFPVGMGAGICFTSYLTSNTLDYILMPMAGAYWNMNSSWSFGINATQWIVFEPYSGGGSVPSSNSRIGYFFDPSLSAIFHF
jgi:hypothetical protein